MVGLQSLRVSGLLLFVVSFLFSLFSLGFSPCVLGPDDFLRPSLSKCSFESLFLLSPMSSLFSLFFFMGLVALFLCGMIPSCVADGCVFSSFALAVCGVYCASSFWIAFRNRQAVSISWVGQILCSFLFFLCSSTWILCPLFWILCLFSWNPCSFFLLFPLGKLSSISGTSWSDLCCFFQVLWFLFVSFVVSFLSVCVFPFQCSSLSGCVLLFVGIHTSLVLVTLTLGMFTFGVLFVPFSFLNSLFLLRLFQALGSIAFFLFLLSYSSFSSSSDSSWYSLRGYYVVVLSACNVFVCFAAFPFLRFLSWWILLSTHDFFPVSFPLFQDPNLGKLP